MSSLFVWLLITPSTNNSSILFFRSKLRMSLACALPGPLGTLGDRRPFGLLRLLASGLTLLCPLGLLWRPFSNPYSQFVFTHYMSHFDLARRFTLHMTSSAPHRLQLTGIRAPLWPTKFATGVCTGLSKELNFHSPSFLSSCGSCLARKCPSWSNGHHCTALALHLGTRRSLLACRPYLNSNASV